MRLALPPLTIRTRLTLWYSAVLLAILLVISVLSYSLLRWAVLRDLDASLLTMAHVLRDTGGVGAQAILGPELADKVFQFADAEGRPGARSPQLGGAALPVSAGALRKAARGKATLETVRLPTGERARLVTVPAREDGRLVQLVQVGMPLPRAERTLERYLETLLVLVPVGVGLAGIGGALVARSALRPVDTMLDTARRITAEDLSGRIRGRGTGDELDRLAATLNGMLARLDAAFTGMRRFSADAAHELRTPLTVLKGQIEVALRVDRSGTEYRGVLASSLEEVERLIRVAEDLLLLSRLSAGGPLRSARVDLEAVVVDVLDAGARLAAGKGVAVRLGPVDHAVTTGDPVAVRRALLNLVENAVKYTPAAGRVELGLRALDGHACLTVRDTGSGIDPADAERIFEPFVRLDAARARETGGAGLGLAIARSIAVAHGGAVTVATPDGGGSLFTLTFPSV